MANSVEELTTSTFDQEVLKSELPVLVDFWGPGCGPCKMLEPVVKEIAAEKAGQAKVFKVNIASEFELAVRYGIKAVPSLLYFKGGEVKSQVVGMKAKAALVSKLDELIQA